MKIKRKVLLSNVGTVKEKMFKYFFANSSRKYINVLDEMVNKDNNTRHSSIKMIPVASNEKNKNIVWLNLNGKARTNPVKLKFSVGDKVRITKKKTVFEKGYTTRWTEEVFNLSQIHFKDPPTYKITDNNGEEIQGTFMNRKFKKPIKKYIGLKKSFVNSKTKHS